MEKEKMTQNTDIQNNNAKTAEIRISVLDGIIIAELNGHARTVIDALADALGKAIAETAKNPDVIPGLCLDASARIFSQAKEEANSIRT